jgi:signal transduction histidine kinase
MKFFKQIKFITKWIPYPELAKGQPLVKWKNRLLFAMLAGLAFIGLIAYIPSIILSVQEKLWAVAAIDTIAYLVLLVIIFSRKISAETKVKTSLITFYFLGIALLILLGKDGAGFNWLFVFPILASFFYEVRGFIVSTLVNIASLTLLIIPIYFEFTSVGLITQYSMGGWIVNSINFLVITSFISFSLMIIISNIDKSLKKQKKMTHLLRENQERLAFEKQRAEESDKLKSAFLANMSHEIRTPLNAILGFSELLANPNLSPEKFNHYNSLIGMSGNQLTRIIDDIIDISKIELNQMKLHIQTVNIFDSVNEVIEIEKTKVRSLKKNIEIEFSVEEELKNLAIETDEMRFKQILENLIGNAVKYTETGKIETTYAIQETGGKKVAEFVVKDTGRGIPENEQEIIFERFAQADNVSFQEGTGLGLSITKGLLQLLGGEIWLKSELGKGSTFYFSLPLETTDNKIIPTQKKSVSKNYQPITLRGKTVFIAEDDEKSYYYLTELLKPAGLKIKRATNGKELLAMLNTEVPDLVLLDIYMPEMNGFEALEVIQKSWPELPVIAQTAYAMENERNKCFELGCRGYISKPFKKEKLFATIHQVLKE